MPTDVSRVAKVYELVRKMFHVRSMVVEMGK